MRVLALAADSGGCAFYRVQMPARHSGVDVTVARELEIGYDSHGKVADARADADVVVMQRPTRWVLAQAIPFLQARGVAVVVEMDDDFTCIDPANPAWWLTHKNSPSDQDAEAARYAARIADLVTVTTPALARRYAPHGRVSVLPNYVPGSWLDIKAGGSGVGWAGTVKTHPHDLQVTRGALADLPFKVIGDGWKVHEHLGLTTEPTVTGIVPLERYPHEVATLDVGIVPLADTAFNRAKSALKLLEYAALGVAGVASPTPDNQRVHADGIGVLAQGSGWRKVRKLLADPTEVAERSREAVRERHTFETNGWRWAEAWARAITNRRVAPLLQPA